MIAGDEAAAEVAMREAMDAGLSSSTIDERLVAPVIWLIGELWERGELSVADKHVATEITVRVLALQREVQRVAQARPTHRVLLATPAGELHGSSNSSSAGSCSRSAAGSGWGRIDGGLRRS